jgi:hypothetical protein
VLEAAGACGVESFVNISTDKAADPVSVLGYSKRIGERLTAYLAGQVDGTYLSVRFGNVLGSRGSVLTALSAQVAAGGPVTVTHPQVSRYFMTADEAVQLVLQAAVIGDDGEVLVLDMGERVLIDDIARRLAARTEAEIDIVYTGLRPGEKLAEVLLGRGELHAPRPRHPLIQHAAVAPLHPDQVTGLDPEVGADYLRATLASCAEYVCPDLARSGTEGLTPPQRHEPRHQLVEQRSGVGVRPRRTPDRVGHVVIRAVPEQRSAVPRLVQAGQPSGQRFAGRPGPDRLPPADQLLQGERAGPHLRKHDHRMPEVHTGHRDDQIGMDQVSHADLAAAVRSGIDAVGSHG